MQQFGFNSIYSSTTGQGHLRPFLSGVEVIELSSPVVEHGEGLDGPHEEFVARQLSPQAGEARKFVRPMALELLRINTENFTYLRHGKGHRQSTTKEH